MECFLFYEMFVIAFTSSILIDDVKRRRKEIVTFSGPNLSIIFENNDEFKSCFVNKYTSI